MTRAEALALTDAGLMPLSRYVEMVVAGEFETGLLPNCGSGSARPSIPQQQDDHGTHHAAAVLLPCAPDGASERGFE